MLKEVEACDFEGALKEANEDAGVHGILLCIIQNFTAPSCGIVASTSTPSTRRLMAWLDFSWIWVHLLPRMIMEGPWTTS